MRGLFILQKSPNIDERGDFFGFLFDIAIKRCNQAPSEEMISLVT